jgi:hypothetical protein
MQAACLQSDEQQQQLPSPTEKVGRFAPVYSVFVVQVFQSFKYLTGVCADYPFIKHLELLQEGLK